METSPMPGTDLYKLVMQYHMLGHPVATIAQETRQTERAVVDILSTIVDTIGESIDQHRLQPKQGTVHSLSRDVQAVMYWHAQDYSFPAISRRTGLDTKGVVAAVNQFLEWLDYKPEPDEQDAPAALRLVGPQKASTATLGADAGEAAAPEVGPTAIIDYKAGRLSVSLDLAGLPQIDLEASLRSLVQLLASHKPV